MLLLTVLYQKVWPWEKMAKKKQQQQKKPLWYEHFYFAYSAVI